MDDLTQDLLECKTLLDGMLADYSLEPVQPSAVGSWYEDPIQACSLTTKTKILHAYQSDTQAAPQLQWAAT